MAKQGLSQELSKAIDSEVNTVHRLFEKQVEKTPDNIALEFKGQVLTYQELNKRANQLAYHLRSLKVGPDVLVGVCMSRSLEMIVCALGILKAGGAYIPIDPTYPRERVNYIIKDSRIGIILTIGQVMENFSGNIAHVINLDDEWSKISERSANNPSNRTGINNLAYCIYTSGSTGSPKGVLCMHKGVVNYLNFLISRFSVNSSDSVLQIATFSFEASVRDIFGSLAAGARLILITSDQARDPSALVSIIVKHKITKILSIVPPMLREIVKTVNKNKIKCKSLKGILVAGDALYGSICREGLGFFDKLDLFVNQYGPTEVTITASYYPIDLFKCINRDIVPIGKPINNVKLFILDQKLRTIRPGEIGEICVGGDYLSRGYLNKKELTDKKFVKISIGKKTERVYKTGDLGRYLPDGDIEFIGRIDNQVKIRGYRIECGEIESLLNNHPDIEQAVVVAKESREKEKALVAFVTPIIKRSALSVEILRNYLKLKLPSYMVPDRYIYLDKFPLSPNGKIDRLALAKSSAPINAEYKYRPPAKEMEKNIARVWREVLGVNRIGRDDSFFSIGGHSLNIIQVQSEILKNFGFSAPLMELFKYHTIKTLARYLAEQKSKTHRTIKQAPYKNKYPLTHAQKRMFILYKLEPDSPFYNVFYVKELSGSLDTSVLIKSINALAVRHESLRTNFYETEGQPFGIINSRSKLSVRTIDLSRITNARNRRQEADKIIKENTGKPFKLESESLVRVILIRMGKDKHLLATVMHHIISDGWSMTIFWRELSILYNALLNNIPAALPPLFIQYKDYAIWERSTEGLRTLKDQEKYWLQKFKDDLPVLNLPLDKVRPKIQTYNGSVEYGEIDKKTVDKLGLLAKKNDTTFFVLLLSLFYVLLYRITDQEDIVVGTVSANRKINETNNIIGIFINNLAIRSKLKKGLDFIKLMNQLKQEVVRSMENEQFSFEHLIEKINPVRDMGRSPIFNVMFQFDPVIKNPPVFRGLRLEPRASHNETAKFDLKLYVSETNNGRCSVCMEYNTDLFYPQTIIGYLKCFNALIQDACSSPDKPISDLRIIDTKTRKALDAFNQTSAPYPKTKTLNQLFEKQVKTTPGKIAVQFRRNKLAYSELNQKANRLAGYMKSRGVENKDVVALSVNRDLDLAVATLALHKAGACCLYIDRNLPVARIRQIIHDSRPRLLVSSNNKQENFGFGENKIISLDNPEINKQKTVNLRNNEISASPAYIIYTSGSTGKPKGVVITHQGVINHVYNRINMMKISSSDVLPLTISMNFIPFTAQFYSSLLSGAHLIIYEEELIRDPIGLFKRMDCDGTTVLLETTVTVLRSFLNHKGKVINLKSLRMIGISGEKANSGLFGDFFKKYPDKLLLYAYGQTECSGMTLNILMNKRNYSKNTRQIVEGTAAGNTQVYILDKNMNLLPAGIPGELYISGDGLSRGYLNDPQQTKKVFLPHPFKENKIIFKTGDIGKRHMDGRLELIGRSDNQVKLRGYRVELGEIEHLFRAYPGIRNCAVTVKKNENKDDVLVAYYETGKKIGRWELRDYFKLKIPDYMMPNYFIPLEKLPLTPNGKLNRASFPDLEEKYLLKNDYEAPRGSIEKNLSEIWKEVLSLRKIGRNDNFFDLGGHSIKAMELVADIKKSFNKNLPLKDIFLCPVFSELAACIEHHRKTASSAIKRAPKMVYYPLSDAQKRIYVQNKLYPGSYLNNVSVISERKDSINVRQFERAVTLLSERHAALRTKFKEINGQPMQIVSDKPITSLQVRFLPDSSSRRHDSNKKEKAIENIIKQPFDLAREAPFRAVLIRRLNTANSAEQKAGDILVLSVHHIVTDKWSMQLLLKELFALYEFSLNNKKPDPPKPSIQYTDYVGWEQSPENQKRLARQSKYWLSRLGDNPPITNLPLDYPRKSVLEYKKGYICDFLDRNTTESLRQTANSRNTSLFMIFFTVVSVYISRLTGNNDLILGTSVTHRNHPDLINLIGYFGNDIAVRIKLKENSSFEELLKQIKKIILRDYQNGEYPLEKLINDLSSARDFRNIRLFNTLIRVDENYIDRPYPKNDMPGVKMNDQKVGSDWGVIFEIYRDKTKVSSEYNTTVLREETVRNWTADLIHLIKQVTNNPGKKIADYEAIAPATREKLLHKFNDTAKYQHPAKAPHHYFEAQARKTPHKTAVAYENQKISYGKLNEEADKLANCLIDKGIKAGDTVAVDIGEAHYLDIPQAILAIHKAGVAAVLIDREQPEKRIEYILRQSKAKAVISDNPAPSYQAGSRGGRQRIAQLDITEKRDQYSSQKPQGPGISGTDTAFITFTSGTTGVPKGIKITARSLVNEAYHKIDHLNELNISAIPQNFSLVYNPSLEFICTSFVLGKKLLLYPKTELYDPYGVMARTEKEKIKFLWLTPSVLSAYLEMIETGSKEKIPLKDLALINLTGEKTHPGLAQRFYSLYGHITLTTDGGCSEVLSYSSYLIPKGDNLQTIKEGKATRNQQVYILDNNQKPLPIGATGEIYVSGYGLANGYIDKKQTKERFLPHPFIKGERIYRTGDRGRFDQTGNLEVMGRLDDQVKIRGQRVEPAEIAEKIKKIAGIGDVLVRPWEKGKNYELALACYYTAKAGYTVSAREIQAALRKEMPQFMIPAYFIALPAFPLNQNGKIDRTRLPAPTEEHLVKTEYAEPKTETEKTIARLWQEMLGVEKVSRHDNFFDLGGHSLKAIQVLARANKTLNINLGLRFIFLYPQLKELAERLEKEVKGKDRQVAIKIPKAPAKEYYPLSYAQERMFVQTKLNPRSPLYNLNIILQPGQGIDPRQFERALAFLASRHAVLRTKFQEHGGQPVQIVSDHPTVKLQTQTLDNSGNPRKDHIARKAAIERIIQTPFDLAQEAPLRAVLFRHKNTSANTAPKAGDILVLSVHHIASDQWSIKILLEELLVVYQAFRENKKSVLPKLSIQYKDYAAWERSDVNRQRLVKQKKYWLSRLGETSPVTALPLDYPRGSILEYEKGYTHDYLDNNTLDKLRQIAGGHKASLLMVLFAVFNMYISKLTGKDDIIVGTSVTHRDNPDLANLIGYLGNDIPVRTRLKDHNTFRELLIQTRKNILRDYQNGEYPLEKLLDDLSGERDTRNIRLFNANIKINENNKEQSCPQDPESGRINNQATDNDWGLIYEIYKDKARLLSEYNAKVLKEETIRAWTADLIHLARQVAANPGKKIADYEAIAPATREKLLHKFNDTAKYQHPTKAPHHYFETQAKKTPHKVAVVYQDKKISYGKLNNEANQLANCLLDKGIEKGDTVAVEIGEAQYISIPKAILAIHKAGAAAVMIDREHPRERIRYILEKSRARAVITDNPSPIYQAGSRGGRQKIAQIDITQKRDKYSSQKPQGRGIAAGDTAFVVFTSGTTGVPKGIKVTARALVNEAYNKVERLDTNDITAIPQNFSYAFIPSLEAVCASFVLGKKLLLYPKQELYDPYAVMKRTEEEKIRLISLTPSVLDAYLETVENDPDNRVKIPLKKLELINLIGEKTSPELARRFYARYPRITLITDYGGTEVQSCANNIIPKGNNLPIIKDGRPTRNQQVYILDNNQKPLPIGATGEIYVSGYGLANGYIDKKQTKERFLPHPFIKGERIYRTGDRGRFDQTGNLEVMGRLDDQVKIRGQRVEPAEIAEKIKKIAGIGDVLVRPWEKGKNYELALACYYTAKAGYTVSAREIQAALRKEMPQFMIPAYFITLPAFPLNQNGKIDRTRLPAPTEGHLVKTEYAEPKTEAEKRMARIWQEVLGVEKTGRYDNFFDLGGHSLKAIQVLIRTKEQFDIKITLRDVFEYPTLAAISEIITDAIIGNIIKKSGL